jgi:GDP-L-fucose synthase
MSTDFYRGKTVVVTGGTGFIGGHFVDALLAAGAKVRVPIHHRAPLPAHADKIDRVPADLSRMDECRRAVAGAQYVFHAAGAVSAAGVTSGSNPMSAITTNLTLTANVIESCWAEGCERLLVFGSSTAYPVTEHPVREDELWSGPTHPSYFGYGWMRRYLERMCEFAAQRSKLGIALCRPTAVYGTRDDFDPKTSHVIPARIREALAKINPYVVWGTGDEARDFLYVTDLIRGCLLLLEKKADCDPINIGFGSPITIREVVTIILKEAGHTDGKVIFDSTKPVTIPKRLVDTSKASRLLGFAPEVTFDAGIRRTIEWYLQKSA